MNIGGSTRRIYSKEALNSGLYGLVFEGGGGMGKGGGGFRLE